MTFIARRVPAGNGCLTPEAVTGAFRILEMTLGPEIAEEALNHMSWPDTFGIACRRAAAKANRRNDQRTLRARRLLDGEISLEALHQLGWIEGENIALERGRCGACSHLCGPADRADAGRNPGVVHQQPEGHHTCTGSTCFRFLAVQRLAPLLTFVNQWRITCRRSF
jgi:hypothetical protein